MRRAIRIGGLMRCCIQTADEYEGEAGEGSVLPCKWCSSSMLFKDGAWSWNREERKD